MENTPQNKIKFFAQYYGQKIMIVPVNENYEDVQKVGISYLSTYGVGFRALKLNSVSKMSDLHLSEIASQSKITIGGNVIDDFSSLAEFRHYLFFSKRDFGSLIYDLIRSFGYAWDWMGLTVEEQVEFGWIKLITE